MSPESDEARAHLVWRSLPPRVAAEHLQRSGSTRLPPSADTSEEVALLYVYGRCEPPKAVAWLPMRDGQSRRRFVHEVTVENRFDTWLTRNRDADVWALATAWHFYRHWIAGADFPHWQSCLLKSFAPNPLLDQLLAITRGWLLWQFQVELLCLAAAGTADQMQRLAQIWRRHDPGELPILDEFLLPNGTRLVHALRERSPKTHVDIFVENGDPDMHLAGIFHALF